MSGGYSTPRPGAVEELLHEIRKLKKRVDELESPTGTQRAGAVAKLRTLINGLQTQIDNLLVVEVNTGNVNASGNVAAGGNVSAGGNVNAVNANLSGTVYSTYALANAVSSGYFALYVNGDGRFGRSVSARRYKQDISAWEPTAQAVFAMQLVTYRLKSAVAELGDAAPTEVGLIAEELIDLGLGWLVLYIDGIPEGIAYEKIALLLLPVVRDHESRLLALEAGA